MLVNYVFLTNRINNNWHMKKVKNNAFCVYTSTYTVLLCSQFWACHGFRVKYNWPPQGLMETTEICIILTQIQCLNRLFLLYNNQICYSGGLK